MGDRDLGASTSLAELPFLRSMPKTKHILASRVLLFLSPLYAAGRKIYPLLSRLRDMLVCVEKRPNIHRLSSPYISMNRPVEGKLQSAAVQTAVSRH